MSNKLQELTEKLYNEGLSKGKAEGEALLEKAQAEADSIMANARAQAKAIIDEAEKKAADIAAKAESDVKMASAQSLQATKKDIENLLMDSICKQGVKESLSDTDFLKKIILAVAEKFSASESSDLSLILPASLKDKLEPWVSSELSKKLGKGLKADFSKKVSGGFRIGPSDGSWYVSLTDETFNELIGEYLRPVTRKLLFG